MTDPTPAPSPAPKSRRWTTFVLIGFGTSLALLLVVLAAWGADALITGDSVNRGVTVSDRDVAGLDEQDLKAVLAGMNIDYGEQPVTISAPSGMIETTAAELGIGIDVDLTAAATLETGRVEPLLNRPWDWMGGIVGERPAPTTYVINRTLFNQTVQPLVEANHQPPVEPSIEATDAGWVPTPGTDGQLLDTEILLEEVASALTDDNATLEFEVTPIPASPTLATADAETLAAEANALTEQVLTVVTGGETVEAGPELLRTWFTPALQDGQLALTFETEAVTEWTTTTFAGLGVEPLDARFELGFGIIIVPSENGRSCCAEGSADQVLAALDSGAGEVELQFEVVEPRLTTQGAEALGIVEPVASFTTEHACCAPRVDNIQLMADTVRGAVILPGETFSLNDYVGPRTPEKGFQPAGAIYGGVFVEDVGGGVSQFATTMFNAAFFAGLDYDHYQAHTIYISRYPYGREATISFPAPDLAIINSSPYGVLIWPTYTGSSITVTLWSTKWVEADQTAQSESGVANGCTRVSTERTRRFFSIEEADRIRGFPAENASDPLAVIDNVFAVYQPSEGVVC